ncbi:MAG TPA: peroxiredoxin-like family protein, partial [Methylophilaceae bacterium]|nr:peroxiredoxin-like family protein [Methylophilaceae bacterium]
MSQQDQLETFESKFRSGKPPYNATAETHAIMERATAELIASGQAGRALKAGDRAPQFGLIDQHGNIVSSTALLVQGPLVATFYRGIWCPYCNVELQAMNEALPAIRALGANLVAVSPQAAPNSSKSVCINALDFPLLSDPRNDTAAAFGLRFTLPDYLVALYQQLKNDLPAFNGDPSWSLPIPARYVIGRDGIVLYSEVNPDY